MNNTHLEYNLKIKLKRIKFLDNDEIKIHEGFYQQVFQGNLYNNVINYIKKLDIKIIYYFSAVIV